MVTPQLFPQLLLPLEKLVVNRESLMMAYENVTYGSGARASRSKGPLKVWALDNGEFLLTDGHHRLVEMLLVKKTPNVVVEIIGEGYTDYWHVPKGRERTTLDPNLRYGGLEDIASVGLLRLDTRYLKQRRKTQ